MRNRLHEYLDRALTEPAAREISAHLHDCAHCREEFQQLTALKASLRRMRVPAGAQAAHERVLARFRRAAAPPVAAPAPRGHGARARRPLLTLLAAPIAAVAIAALAPVSLVAPVVESGAHLPGPAEMAVLSERHDLHVAHAETSSDALPDEAVETGGSGSNE